MVSSPCTLVQNCFLNCEPALTTHCPKSVPMCMFPSIIVRQKWRLTEVKGLAQGLTVAASGQQIRFIKLANPRF